MDPRFALQTCEALLAEWRSNADGQALSQDESVRAQSITSLARRQQFFAGRWLAKTMLSDALGGTPAAWHISADPHTKPRVLDHSVQISIAHSGDYVACALADEAVGIDVERMKPQRSIADIAEWVFSAQEQHELLAAQGDAAFLEFNRLWTRKEARLKQLGLPFDMTALRAIQTSPVESGAATGGTWSFTGQGLVVSLAANSLSQLRMRWPPHWVANAVQWYRYV